ncbi:Uncharacterised protein [Mycobacteroides abscessus subsp. abscessus]|nr:Uncharacterised protein [Mycobacteroides abscessus subsp. abscessus]
MYRFYLTGNIPGLFFWRALGGAVDSLWFAVCWFSLLRGLLALLRRFRRLLPLLRALRSLLSLRRRFGCLLRRLLRTLLHRLLTCLLPGLLRTTASGRRCQIRGVHRILLRGLRFLLRLLARLCLTGLILAGLRPVLLCRLLRCLLDRLLPGRVLWCLCRLLRSLLCGLRRLGCLLHGLLRCIDLRCLVSRPAWVGLAGALRQTGCGGLIVGRGPFTIAGLPRTIGIGSKRRVLHGLLSTRLGGHLASRRVLVVDADSTVLIQGRLIDPALIVRHLIRHLRGLEVSGVRAVGALPIAATTATIGAARVR